MQKVVCGTWLVVLMGACSTTERPHHGVVQFVQFTGSQVQATAGAFFTTTPSFPAGAGDGPCSLLGAPSDTGFSAGEIDVSGTVAPIVLLPCGVGPNVIYNQNVYPDPVFSSGATIQVEAHGGPDVGAFTGTVMAPTDLTGFTSPTALSRSGYTATWTAVAGSTVEVDILASNSSHQGAILQCTVEDTGSFTVPASSFALIPQDLNTAGVEVARTANSAPEMVGDVSVVIQAASKVSTASFTLGP